MAMIDAVLVMMFQAAAGAPQATPPTSPTSPTEQTTPSDTATNATPNSQQTNNQQQDQGIRCQRETTTGSIIGARRCSTRQQRREREENAARDADHLQRATSVVQP